MRMSSIVIPVLLFTGVFVGFQNFGLGLYDNANVEAEGFQSINEEKKDLDKKWTNDGSSRDTWTEESDAIEDAVGVLLIPRLAGDIIGVGTTINTIVEEASASRWMPSWAVTTFQSVTMASIFFALAGAYLRYRA